MTTGANFKIKNGRVLWYKPLVYGDELLTQDHEARARSKQGLYKSYPEYGNPFINTLTLEISKVERDLLLVANMRECTLQDSRFVDCTVDETSINEANGMITFKYELSKADGGKLEQEFSSDLT